MQAVLHSHVPHRWRGLLIALIFQAVELLLLIGLSGCALELSRYDIRVQEGSRVFGAALFRCRFSVDFDLEEGLANRASLIASEVQLLHNALALGGDLGDHLVGRDLTQIVMLVQKLYCHSVSYLVDSLSFLHEPLPDCGFFGAFAQVRHRNAHDLCAEWHILIY